MQDEPALKKIAIEYMGVNHWETMGSDSIDLHNLSIASIRKALEAAYIAGQNSTTKSQHPEDAFWAIDL